MERNAEDVRVEREEAGGAVKQCKEEGGHVDWVVALQSPLMAEDMVRLLQELLTTMTMEELGPEPDTLAFLEDMQQTLRLERCGPEMLCSKMMLTLGAACRFCWTVTSALMSLTSLMVVSVLKRESGWRSSTSTTCPAPQTSWWPRLLSCCSTILVLALPSFFD